MGDLNSQLKRWIRPLKNRVQNMIAKAVIDSVSDAAGIQSGKITVLNGETLEGVPRLGEYGFVSKPKKGAEAVIIAPGGNSESSIIIATEDSRYRLKTLSEGEVGLYTDEGDSILLKRGNKIEIKSSAEVTVDSPSVKLGGSSFIPLDGVITGQSIDPFTGNKHIDFSAKVQAKK